MRRIVALILAASIPASASAQVRGGIVLEAAPRLTAAPAALASAPALALSAPALSVSPALAPAPASPAAPALPLDVAARPVAAVQPAASAARLVPAALAAIKPAASEKSGSEQARAAGAALFDGTLLSAPAIGDGPSVPASAPEDRRSSGLSPPTDAEITAAYRAANPKGRAVEAFGRDFVGAAAQAMQKYTFMGSYFLEALKSQPREIYHAAAELIATHDKREDPASRRFLELLGRLQGFVDHSQERLVAMKIQMMRRMGREPARSLPPSPIAGGEYWDMAAGMNAQGFIHRELEPGTRYTFFDYSPFVVSYLKTAAELAGAANAGVVEADLLKLNRPTKPLAVLRTKNAVHYVPGFDKKLEVMADWIAPGGQLIIQNDPNPAQRGMIIEKHGPLIRRLIAEGWKFDYGFSGRAGEWGAYALDTIVLTRPAAASKSTAQEADRQFASYVGAVKYLEKDFDPFAALFR